MECRIFFVSYSCNVRSSLLYECRRPKFDVDANQQQEVLMLTPSCVAAVGVLINGQALSTQAQRSALTHFAICPLMVLLLLPSITSLPALAELSSGRFHVPTPMPFPMRVHKLILRRGNIHPNLFRNSRSKFCMEANHPFHQDNLIIPPPCVAAPKSDRGRVSTS